MKTIKNYEGARVIKATGDVFIIPNDTLKISTSMFKDKTLDNANLLYPLNNLSTENIEEDAEFVQTWIVSEEDLNTDNLGSHGASMMIDGVMYDLIFENSFMREYIPIDLFVGKKEGDVITVRFPVNIVNADELRAFRKKSAEERTFEERPEGENVILELELKLDQLDYRYRRFGTFEDTLDMLHPGIYSKVVKWANESDDSNCDEHISRIAYDIEMAVKISEIKMDILEYKMSIQRASNHVGLAMMLLSDDCDVDERIQILDDHLGIIAKCHEAGMSILNKTENALDFCDKDHDAASYDKLKSIKETILGMIKTNKDTFHTMTELVNALKEIAKNCK